MDAWGSPDLSGDLLGERDVWGSLDLELVVGEGLNLPLPWPPSHLPSAPSSPPPPPVHPPLDSLLETPLMSPVSADHPLPGRVGERVLPARDVDLDVGEHIHVQVAQVKIPKEGHGIALIPAIKPPKIQAKDGGFSTSDWVEAAKGCGPSSKLTGSASRSVKRKTKKVKTVQRDSRPLGIVGHAALESFHKVPSIPIEVYVRKDRYPELPTSPGLSSNFVATCPILKPLTVLPNKTSPAVLQMIECGYRDPEHPQYPCRMLAATVKSWEDHQYLQHGIGFLCSKCHSWFPDDDTARFHFERCGDSAFVVGPKQVHLT